MRWTYGTGVYQQCDGSTVLFFFFYTVMHVSDTGVYWHCGGHMVLGFADTVVDVHGVHWQCDGHTVPGVYWQCGGRMVLGFIDTMMEVWHLGFTDTLLDVHRFTDTVMNERYWVFFLWWTYGTRFYWHCDGRTVLWFTETAMDVRHSVLMTPWWTCITGVYWCCDGRTYIGFIDIFCSKIGFAYIVLVKHEIYRRGDI